MPNRDAVPSRYLAEWYTRHTSDRAITDVSRYLREALPAPIHARQPELLYALHVPQDDYAFGVFAADSAEIVADVCHRAGLPADRVTEAFETALADPMPD